MAQSKKSKVTVDNDNMFYLKGILLSPSLTSAVRGTHPKDTRVCYRTSIKTPHSRDLEGLIDMLVTAYANTNLQYQPAWIKELLTSGDLPEYINFKSNYPLRCYADTPEGRVEIDRSTINNGAEGVFCIKVDTKDEGNEKATSLYLTAFLMLKNGNAFNPFEGY